MLIVEYTRHYQSMHLIINKCTHSFLMQKFKIRERLALKQRVTKPPFDMTKRVASEDDAHR